MTAYECDDDLSVGDLSIDDVPMFCAAWRMENLHQWWLPAEQRGVTRVRPGVDGSKGFRRRRAMTRRQIDLLISGEVDRNGVPAANWFEGLYANIADLSENLVDPVDSDTGERTATLTLPDGSIKVGQVQVLGMTIPDTIKANARYCYAAIDVQLMRGYLEPGGS